MQTMEHEALEHTHTTCNKYQRMWYRKDIRKWKAMKKNCVFVWNACECVRVRDQLATACLCFCFEKKLLYSSLGCSTGTIAHFFSGVRFSALRNNIHFPRVNIVTDMVKIIFGDYSFGFICVCTLCMHWSEIRYLL